MRGHLDRKDGMLMATLYAGSLIGMVHFISDLPGMGRWILGGRVPRYSPRYAWSFRSQRRHVDGDALRRLSYRDGPLHLRPARNGPLDSRRKGSPLLAALCVVI